MSASSSPLTSDAFFSMGRGRPFYPSPFFDIASTYLPENPKALFRYCRYYYYTIGVIGAAVDIHAAYPVTDMEIDNDDEALKDKWEDLIKKRFRLKSFLVEIGKDYVATGNAFISFYIPFDRFLVCPHCKAKKKIDSVTYAFKNFKFEGNCWKCNNLAVFRMHDVKVKDLTRVNLVRWSPENIDIEYNPITGQSVYRYQMPNYVRRLIHAGRRHVIESIPAEFLVAAKNRKPIFFNRNNLYHLKRPSLAEANMGWGEPALIRVLKDTYYLQVLRKAREAIAHQHIVPLWVMFPASQGELNPYEHLNLAEWRTRLEDELRKWKQDPNYIPIMPIPLGFQFIGGNYKQMDTTPEIQNLLLNILAGMNMPQEFVYGGLQYSGTSFSIRMLSNLFESYRSQLLDFVNNFFIKKLGEQFSIKPVSVHFTDLKLADDVQKKALLMQLNQQNKVSTSTMMSELGLDGTEETEKIRQELKNSADIIAQQMINSEKAKAAAMLENVRGQVKAQLMQGKILDDVQDELGKEGLELTGEMGVKVNPRLFEALFRTAGPGREDEFGEPMWVIQPSTIPTTVKALAKALEQANEKRRNEALAELQKSWPVLSSMVAEHLNTVPSSDGGGGNGKGRETLPRPQQPKQPKVDMRPEPQQKPPRRK